MSLPSFEIEDSLSGVICGVDEVGRGPLAGPVVAAAIILPKDICPDILSIINDSKKVSQKKRKLIYQYLIQNTDYCIAEASVEEIDKINILQASLLAMKRSILGLKSAPDIALIDGNKEPDINIQCKTVIKGDQKSLSIAAASIIAKEYRDNLMAELAKEYNMYGWEKNAGYGTKLHKLGIEKHGITVHHRTSFKPIYELINLNY